MRTREWGVWEQVRGELVKKVEVVGEEVESKQRVAVEEGQKEVGLGAQKGN